MNFSTHIKAWTSYVSNDGNLIDNDAVENCYSDLLKRKHTQERNEEKINFSLNNANVIICSLWIMCMLTVVMYHVHVVHKVVAAFNDMPPNHQNRRITNENVFVTSPTQNLFQWFRWRITSEIAVNPLTQELKNAERAFVIFYLSICLFTAVKCVKSMCQIDYGFVCSILKITRWKPLNSTPFCQVQVPTAHKNSFRWRREHAKAIKFVNEKNLQNKLLKIYFYPARDSFLNNSKVKKSMNKIFINGATRSKILTIRFSLLAKSDFLNLNSCRLVLLQ